MSKTVDRAQTPISTQQSSSAKKTSGKSKKSKKDSFEALLEKLKNEGFSASGVRVLEALEAEIAELREQNDNLVKEVDALKKTADCAKKGKSVTISFGD